jgi:hypothetical protein
MGRPVSVAGTLANPYNVAATYNSNNQLLTLAYSNLSGQFVEGRSYNTLGQLTGLSADPMGMQYIYNTGIITEEWRKRSIVKWVKPSITPTIICTA